MLAEEILMVNDGSLLLKMMGGLLENQGFRINLTDSPEEALEWLSTRHIVLVVMKLNAQTTDRLAVSHMVKELNGGAKLVILGESIHLPAEIFEIEADDYILLPCRAAEIWRRILSCLKTVSSQPARSPEKGRVPPVNRKGLNHLEFMFHDPGSRLASSRDGEKISRRKKMAGRAARWRPVPERPSEAG